MSGAGAERLLGHSPGLSPESRQLCAARAGSGLVALRLGARLPFTTTRGCPSRALGLSSMDPSGRPRPGIGVYSLTAEEARIHVSAEMRRTLVHVYDEDEGTRSRWAAAAALFTPLRL